MSMMEVNTAVVAAASKSKIKIKSNKKGEKDTKGKGSKGKGKDVMMLNYGKFEGQGLNFKCKMFGFVEVAGPRGDKSSVQAIHQLKQQAKQLKKGANEHKLKIIFNVTLQGIKIINEKTQTIEHEHQIHKISFISHDPEDRYVFGYIYSPPRDADQKRKYLLFAIKSEKQADAITSQLYELFQVVYKMQEYRRQQATDVSSGNPKPHNKPVSPLEPLQDKMLLEVSSKIGVDTQQTEEPVYAEPTFVQASPSLPVNKGHHYSVPSNKPSNTDAQQQEIASEKNGVEEVQSETLLSVHASSPFGHDPFNSSEMEGSNKEISEMFSDNVFRASSRDDSGFGPDFDSTVPSDKAKFDSVQFEANFDGQENGFTSSEISENTSVPVGGAVSSLSDRQLLDESCSKNESIGDSDTNATEVNLITSHESGSFDVKTTDELPLAKDEKDVTASGGGNEFYTEDASTFPSSVFSNVLEKNAHSNTDLGDNPEVTQGEELFETTTGDNTFGNADFFEAKAGIDNANDDLNKEEFMFFPQDDPFSSTANQDSASFGQFVHDDPFSSQGTVNAEILSDPFAESDNLFGVADFSDMDKNKYFFGGEQNIAMAAGGNDQPVQMDKDEDIFEAAFEANMEEGLEEDVLQSPVLTLSGDATCDSVRTTSKGEHENPENDHGDESYEAVVTDTEEVEAHEAVAEECVKNTAPDNTASTDLVEKHSDVRVNTLDLSTNDDYVTLKTAARSATRPLSPTATRPLSPTEFTPPPLPPRPPLQLVDDPPDSPDLPKEPPALPPRPANQPLNADNAMRRPPELPPRVDLEEHLGGGQRLSSDGQDIDIAPQNEIFSADLDDFDDPGNNDGLPPFPRQDSATFDMGDPFQDPFHGADPFQTPIGIDPFKTPIAPRFSSSYEESSKEFDPFSGDDSFTTTLTFDQAEDEHGNGDKNFADFSEFS